jgi:hypothetical protein
MDLAPCLHTMLSSNSFLLTARDIRIDLLAAVQFATIVGFMIVMPLGPQLIRGMQLSPLKDGGQQLPCLGSLLSRIHIL